MLFSFMTTIKEQYQKTVVPTLMKKYGHKTPMAVPRIQKIVLNVGTGRMRDKKDAVETVERHLALITGQRAFPRPVKKAIASFKTRIGMIVGYQVTLRGTRMMDFLERLIRFAIARTRDFRGISLSSVDRGGNLTLGVKEHIVFPEMIGEDVKNIFGLEVTICTNAKTREEAMDFFRLLGFPLQK